MRAHFSQTIHANLKLRPIAISVHLALLPALTAGICLSANAQVVAAVRQYDIPAGALDQSLTRFAQQAGVSIAVDAAKLKGLASQGLRGTFTVEEGFAALLRGSGYTVSRTPSGYVLTPVSANTPEKTQVLPVVEVTGTAVAGYAVQRMSTATKTDTPLLQTPMTVEVLPQQILKEQGQSSGSLPNALTYLGVQNLGMKDQGDYLIFRGFSSPTTLWNGFRIEDATPGVTYANGSVWMNNVEQLEVLKGPASILYGRTEPGGAVNVLTKKPLENFQGEVNTGVGSWSSRWLDVDLTGALNEDKTLLYRINIANEDSDSWYSHGPKSHSQGIAPALEWRISPQTKLSFEGQYRRFEGGTNAQQYIPIDPATNRPISVSRKDTMLPGNISEFRQDRSYVALDHQFNPDWSLSWKVMHNDANNPHYRNNLAAGGSIFPLGPGQTFLYVFEGQNRQKTDATMLDITGHFATSDIKHTVLLGADYYNKRFTQLSGADFAQATDYLDPDLPARVALTDTWSLRNREYSWYLQDQMELPGNWHLLLGGRQQSIRERNVSDMPSMFSGPQDVTYKKTVFLPRFGLLWQPAPWLSTYYSYAENMGSSNGLEASGSPIKPEWSKQHEVGIKSEWLNGRLLATFAVFNLTKFNVASADLANPGFNIGVGEVRSTGYELNIQGALTPAWSMLANYSHARPHVITGASGATALQPQTIVAGQDLPFVSNDTFALWTSYRLPGESLSGWTIGGGVNWASAPNPVDGATIKTRSYTVTSAFASYETRLAGKKATLQLNVNNLFDKKYLLYQNDDVSVGGNTLAGSWGTPRQIRMNMRVEF